MVNFSHNFKHIVLSCPDELASLPYITKKVLIHTFQPKYNVSKIPFVDKDTIQIVYKGLERLI